MQVEAELPRFSRFNKERMRLISVLLRPRTLPVWISIRQVRMEANSEDVGPLHKLERNLRPEAEDQSWTFLPPVIVAAAAACLLLYFFLRPAFYVAADTPIARS